MTIIRDMHKEVIKAGVVVEQAPGQSGLVIDVFPAEFTEGRGDLVQVELPGKDHALWAAAGIRVVPEERYRLTVTDQQILAVPYEGPDRHHKTFYRTQRAAERAAEIAHAQRNMEPLDVWTDGSRTQFQAIFGFSRDLDTEARYAAFWRRAGRWAASRYASHGYGVADLWPAFAPFWDGIYKVPDLSSDQRPNAAQRHFANGWESVSPDLGLRQTVTILVHNLAEIYKLHGLKFVAYDVLLWALDHFELYRQTYHAYKKDWAAEMPHLPSAVAQALVATILAPMPHKKQTWDREVRNRLVLRALTGMLSADMSEDELLELDDLKAVVRKLTPAQRETLWTAAGMCNPMSLKEPSLKALYRRGLVDRAYRDWEYGSKPTYKGLLAFGLMFDDYQNDLFLRGLNDQRYASDVTGELNVDRDARVKQNEHIVARAKHNRGLQTEFEVGQYIQHRDGVDPKVYRVEKCTDDQITASPLGLKVPLGLKRADYVPCEWLRLRGAAGPIGYSIAILVDGGWLPVAYWDDKGRVFIQARTLDGLDLDHHLLALEEARFLAKTAANE